MAIIELKSIIKTLASFRQNWKFALLDQWPTIIGSLNSKISLEKVTENSVVLGVIDSCWMQELYLLTPLIQSLINKSLDKPRIKKVIFKQKNNFQHKKQLNIKNKRSEMSHIKCIPVSSKESAALVQIQDEELRHFLTQFRNRCLAGDTE